MALLIKRNVFHPKGHNCARIDRHILYRYYTFMLFFFTDYLCNASFFFATCQHVMQSHVATAPLPGGRQPRPALALWSFTNGTDCIRRPIVHQLDGLWFRVSHSIPINELKSGWMGSWTMLQVDLLTTVHGNTQYMTCVWYGLSDILLVTAASGNPCRQVCIHILFPCHKIWIRLMLWGIAGHDTAFQMKRILGAQCAIFQHVSAEEMGHVIQKSERLQQQILPAMNGRSTYVGIWWDLGDR